MHRIQEAARRLELRIALAGEGWSDRVETAGGGTGVSIRLPGGAMARIGEDGAASLSRDTGALLGSGDINDDAFFASFMHNCDDMIAREFGKGTAEIVEFADAVAEQGPAGLEDVLRQSVRTSSGRDADVLDRHLVASRDEVKAAGESSDPRLRAAYYGWLALSSVSPYREPREWDDWASLVRWHGRIAAETRTEEPRPTVNGYWTRIESQCGLVEAARSLGMIEGRLGGYTGERQLHALRMVGYGTGVGHMEIVAVAVFEDDELVSVVRHADRTKRPRERIAADVVAIVEAVERAACERGIEDYPVFPSP